jgi:hypothetical protein
LVLRPELPLLVLLPVRVEGNLRTRSRRQLSGAAWRHVELRHRRASVHIHGLTVHVHDRWSPLGQQLVCLLGSLDVMSYLAMLQSLHLLTDGSWNQDCHVDILGEDLRAFLFHALLMDLA